MIRPGDPMSRLDARRRARDLAALRSEPLDVLVIGGGVTGAGVALDAASRGLRVALVERHDLAFGTSRWSSKLIHGGLRYLAKGDVPIAWESAVERALIGTRIAPHLVRPLTQVLPVPDARTGAVLRAGLLGADALRVLARTPRDLLPASRRLTVEELRRLAPALRTDGIRGGLALTDLQLQDDARFVVALARTAAAYGALVLTGLAAEEVDGGTVLLRHEEDRFEVAPRWVVNATGVWAGRLDPSVRLSPSRGSHLVLRSQSLLDSPASIAVGVPGAFGRFVFTLPQPDGLTLVGLTDEPIEGPLPEVPVAPDEDVEWILSVLNTALARPVGREEVVGRFAGLRPLLAGSAGSADLSRRHAVVRHGRLITITGGKFTAYRRMARDVVDLISRRPCRTGDIALVGAGPVRSGVPGRLARRYGSEAHLVWDYTESDPALAQPLADGVPVIGAEVAFARDWEGARSVADVLERRTRIALVDGASAAAAPRVAEILGG